jgi:hypothetical protein
LKVRNYHFIIAHQGWLSRSVLDLGICTTSAAISYHISSSMAYRCGAGREYNATEPCIERRTIKILRPTSFCNREGSATRQPSESLGQRQRFWRAHTIDSVVVQESARISRGPRRKAKDAVDVVGIDVGPGRKHPLSNARICSNHGLHPRLTFGDEEPLEALQPKPLGVQSLRPPRRYSQDLFRVCPTFYTDFWHGFGILSLTC